MPSKSTSHKQVGVIGAGSFGTAVANLLAHNADVLLYVHRQDYAEGIPPTPTAGGYPLAPNVTPTYHLAEVAEHCTVLFPIVPSEAFRTMMRQLAPSLKPDHVLIHGTKGLDVYWPGDVGPGVPTLTRKEVKTMSEVIQEESVVRRVGCLAGPNLSRELAQGQPAATVVASPLETVIAQGQQLLRSHHFQVYGSTDMLGVELCGVLKNIMAIGAGCLSGLGYGENAKSLWISRGMVEMIHIGQAMGATVRPFLGLAGVGDLIATCTSSLSRNHTLGYRLAQGATLSQLIQTGETTEGVHTVKTIRSLAKHYRLRVPIIGLMYRVLFEDLAVQEAIRYFMKYPLNDVDVDFL
ncbi:MAG: NAD(P)-dependent glycerol-3-phosphate dehydrogenase [Amoebophilaceae bacterium]|jgi:glycerol-3-phosphate dehydrogenase (NAD(P)+)|nr:NAD(P)-dependent glycerol-3-phosphate dehydrogenase [Amoebophilaceae bacterium]